VVGARPLEEGATVRKEQVVIELDKQLEELDLERKRLARELAASELERLKSLAQRNAISVSKEEIEKKRSEFEIAKVDHELAAAVLKRRQLISPIDGQVAQFFKDVGEKCEDQQPVVRIVDTRRCHLVANLEPRLAQSLRLNQKVRVEVLVGDAPVTVEGTLIYLSPVADAASGLLRIKAVFENPEGKIRPGIAGRLRID
jgi:RND family efflux transporter MFP subunit